MAHYTWQIANRYLRSKRRTGFISLITYLSAGGVALGAAALVMVLSIMNGFEDEVRSRIVGADAPLRLTSFVGDSRHADWRAAIDTLLSFDKVEAATPFVLDKGMIRKHNTTEGCIIRGIDPATVADVTSLDKMLLRGNLAGLDEAPDEEGGIILGRYLAETLVASPGDTVYLLSPTTGAGPFAQPRVGRFVVEGVFESGLAEFDQVFALISLRHAQEMFGLGDRVSGIDVRTTTLEDAAEVKLQVEERLGYPWWPRTWFEMRKTLFSWMQLEKWAMFIVLSLIILVAAFNIVSTLVMVTMEKRKEIGILAAMGATRRDVKRIFMLQGLVVGLIGAGVGLGIGYGLLAAQLKYKFFQLPPDIYMINTLPVKLVATDFLAVGSVALLLCLLAAVYPAARAAKLDPVEAIRYE